MRLINFNKNIKPLYLSHQGMTLIELVVVMSIFAVMSSVVIFNYGAFQAKVDIKNLANDIALKVVEAQKSALAGKLPPLVQQALIPNITTWKPAYGTYFSPGSNSFIYYTDLDQNAGFSDITCPSGGECLSKISITKNNVISRLDVFYVGGTTATLNDLTATFTRPNSDAIIKSSTTLTLPVSYVQITISSPQSVTGTIKIYPSGRVQIN